MRLEELFRVASCCPEWFIWRGSNGWLLFFRPRKLCEAAMVEKQSEAAAGVL